MEQAASFFVTATAWHALVDVGRIRPGETVLIHSAAGGVGLAAVGIARAFGLRVIATAGTERKRAWLREQGLDLVLDSRTLDFAEEARRATGGRGVDIVLNALAGPAIEQGLRALAPGGRFLELGKKDLADHRSLMMGAFNRRLTFSAIDLDRAATEEPGYFKPLALQVVQAFTDGRLRHLPARFFSADDVIPAFRALASGDWIGKVVIGMRQGSITVFPNQTSTFRPRRNRSWLVTGGLGGFGLGMAGMLVRAGVSRVVLCGRRGIVEDKAALTALQQQAEVEVVGLNVTHRAAVDRLVQHIEASRMPLGGVIHAANVYADQPLSDLDAATLERALGAKALGAWNLHLATEGLDLEAFLLCSSVATQVGNPGQGAYAAANCFLDGLAELRRTSGLPGTSIALGAIGGTGLVARDHSTELHLRSLGLVPMPAERLAEAVGVAMAEGQGRVGLVDIDWDRWMEAHPATPWKRLAALKERENSKSSAGFREQLAALPEGERVAAALAALREASAPVFRMEAAALDGRRPLRDQGLDSLMAVELSAALRSRLKLEITAMDLLGGRSLAALAERLVGAAANAGGAEPPAPAPPASIQPLPSAEDEHSPEPLRKKICVTAPYEALEQLRQQGSELWAEASPVILGDEGPISTAELGRHLAILGSMAVATLHPDTGQHAYPVHTAEIELAEEGGPPVERVRLRARGLSCDPQRRSGSAETELFDLSGRRLGSMRVGYHVIPMGMFRTLFSEKARFIPPGPDPYRQRELPRLLERGDRNLVMELGPVRAQSCQGHFDDLPALPVSILGRHVFAAVAEAARCFDGQSQPRLRRARLLTHRFIWAGDTARLDVQRIPAGWSCDIRVGPELCARFELELVGGDT